MAASWSPHIHSGSHRSLLGQCVDVSESYSTHVASRSTGLVEAAIIFAITTVHRLSSFPTVHFNKWVSERMIQFKKNPCYYTGLIIRCVKMYVVLLSTITKQHLAILSEMKNTVSWVGVHTKCFVHEKSALLLVVTNTTTILCRTVTQPADTSWCNCYRMSSSTGITVYFFVYVKGNILISVFLTGKHQWENSSSMHQLLMAHLALPLRLLHVPVCCVLLSSKTRPRLESMYDRASVVPKYISSRLVITSEDKHTD